MYMQTWLQRSQLRDRYRSEGFVLPCSSSRVRLVINSKEKEKKILPDRLQITKVRVLGNSEMACIKCNFNTNRKSMPIILPTTWFPNEFPAMSPFQPLVYIPDLK